MSISAHNVLHYGSNSLIKVTSEACLKQAGREELVRGFGCLDPLRALLSLRSLRCVSDEDLLWMVGFLRGLAVQHAGHPFSIQRSVPACDGDGADTVADQVRDRPALRHEAIDADDERQAGDR